ncbi:MAG: hypothetical protein PHF18_06210 [Methanosarcina sp.]|uniref:hypothetical protein n=1 Tax=Methanosarcina sp. TaxID=2213 RepID=UPI0026243CCF|nr:hypothetical protein [Methanosarcina sp.]MDD3246431.1 hypothetical protein [Methanosarcina sp.]
MVSEENNETVEERISLSEYLIPDTPEILEIESLECREPEYIMYLGAVEYSIALYYYEGDRKIEDKDVILALENIKLNYELDLSFFSRDLEIQIINYLIGALSEKPITHHEFRLVIDYVLWVIEKRTWMEDKQAYVKWIAYVMGLYSEVESIKYETDFKRLAEKRGMSEEDIDLLLLKGEDDDFSEAMDFEGFPGEDIGKSKPEMDFALMPDEEKYNFLLEKGQEFSGMLEFYIYELAENKEFEKIKELYSKLSEKYPDFMYLHFLMGAIHISIDPVLAKSCFERTLEMAEKDENVPETILESLRLNISSLEEQL